MRLREGRERGDSTEKSGGFRREMAGEELVWTMSPTPLAEQRPEWMPEGWAAGFRERKASTRADKVKSRSERKTFKKFHQNFGYEFGFEPERDRRAD